MRVRIVTTNTFPDGFAASSRIRCYTKALVLTGATVTIMAPRNVAPLPGRAIGYRGTWEGARYILLGNGAFMHTRTWRLGEAFLASIVSTLHTVLTMPRFDVCIVFGGGVWSRIILAGALRLAGKKVVYELNEFPFSTEGSRIERLPFVQPFLRQIFLRLALPLSNGVIVISTRLAALVARHAPRSEVLQLPILIEQTDEETAPRRLEQPRHYIFHSGTLSERKDGIITAFRAFATAHHRLKSTHGIELKLYLTNFTALEATKRALRHILVQSRLEDDLIVTGFCSTSELNRLMQDALVLVVNKPQNLQNRHNFPTKLGPYLMSGTPVIVAAADCEVNMYLRNRDNAIVVPPDDGDAIANAVVFCYEHAAEARRIGARGRRTSIDAFYFQKHASEFSRFLETL